MNKNHKNIEVRVGMARKKFEEVKKFYASGFNAKQISTIMGMQGYKNIKQATVAGYLKHDSYEEYSAANIGRANKRSKKMTEAITIVEPIVPVIDGKAPTRESINEILDSLSDAYEKLKRIKWEIN